MANWKKALKQVWNFIWNDDSIWSWLANIALAFILIKFIVYPGLAFALATTHPVVAVVSESMEHNADFDNYWENAKGFYVANNIKKEDFVNFPLKNGFRKGDIMILKGKNAQDIKIGDIIVFWSARRDPIIHRVVRKWQESGVYYFQTKGDNYVTNPTSIKSSMLDETRISQDKVIGNAVFKIPFLGYIKIWFVEFVANPVMNLRNSA
ncbi:MAG TPA: signal peptidase I [Candidatus Nanoarchaeia archaeon]|nr:signal peptidase I [Candidatus Nanoarchaeia archaeon]